MPERIKPGCQSNGQLSLSLTVAMETLRHICGSCGAADIAIPRTRQRGECQTECRGVCVGKDTYFLYVGHTSWGAHSEAWLGVQMSHADGRATQDLKLLT